MLNPFFFRTLVDKNHDTAIVKMIQHDNSTKIVEMGVAEAELNLFLKCNMKIRSMDVNKAHRLLELIENYKNEK